MALTEAWALCRGLEWVWGRGIRRLEIRTDSWDVHAWVKGKGHARGHLGELINECKAWINKDWDAEIVAIYREQNIVADKMAKIATRSKKSWEELSDPPEECIGALMDDKMGFPISRVTNEENTRD